MKKLMTVVCLVLTFSVGAWAKESQLEKATNVLNEIMDTPDKGIPHDLFEKAVCVGIVPSEIKGAFLVTAGPVGRTAEGATDAQLHAEILSYSRTRGLFAGVSLDGAVVKQAREDNHELYGRKITAREILIDGTVSAPAAAIPLDEALAKYSPRGGRSFASLEH
jgi:lipid-binding SYLF domain-containing protein